MGLFGGRKKDKGAQPAPADSKADQDAADGHTAAAEDLAPVDAPPKFSDKDIANARRWFKRATELKEDRNYDYAIESYLTGLKFWPEAVEEGHQHLRVAAYARWETKGKKPNTLAAMKHSMSGKDPAQAMLNAAWLWAHDPHNLSYMEGMVKNAAKANYEETVLYIGPIYFEAAKTEKKLHKDRFLLLRKTYEELGERCETRGDLGRALTFFEGALTVLQVLQSLSGATMKFTQELKDLATKVTIIKGQYDSSSDFRGSMKDSDAQKDIHDRERMVMDEDRLDQLIADAERDWKANPGVSAKLINLVDLLCRAEEPQREELAVKLLEGEFASSKNYSYKSRADDIRMKHLRRNVRLAMAKKDKDATRQAQVEQLRFELRAFKERTVTYGTDNKIKFEYGKRLVTARKFDEAIPVLQEARNDPKNRILCMNLIGRCFYEKGYHAQAIQTYTDAIKEHELTGDDLSKDLYYWLGRTCEAADRKEDAEKAYGQLIQWDYNFKDVRDRLAALE